MQRSNLQKIKVITVWLVLCGIWSSNWTFSKIGLADLPPVSFAALRFAVGAAILLLILRAKKLTFPRNRRFWMLAGANGLFQFVHFALLFWGLQHISSGLAAVLQATIPTFGLILAQFYLPEEGVTPRKIFAVLLGIVGVGAIFYEQLNFSGGLAFAGSAALIVASFFAAFATILTKARGGKFNMTTLLTAQLMIGFVPLALVGFVWEGSPVNFHWSWTAIICVFYLALIGLVAAFLLYYWLLRKIEISKAMMISLVTPLAAVLIGSFFGEVLQWQTLAGGALILGSVGLILIQPKKKLVAANTEEELLSAA